ncbi:acetyl-CoA carboxylase biotin carboxylase subunit [Peptostreptococcus equinus]|uniref:biotin carboxylase n=1 Tax=Peptostreptococcus equinus TaxID=3003601 RepID=A0ABY7JMB0_9FIRM|nr:acetyl-CoA carboxylase biotin carboxylase subunit [Peptostreptococcus sp. CBA3647]WAW14299.1 acetyl-CoA carboxylase biotin carboxylase subunit [Peptostreptococcus sp. CBA3647]
MSTLIKKVLIANRGEIAVRIIRTLKDMNIKTVAIYSIVDKESLHTKLADEAICIGPKDIRKSYLNKMQIINAALVTSCDAIHPGFGFLSENASFAKLCEVYNIKFIGPTSKVIDLMGNKNLSKSTMEKAGLPLIPGSKGILESLENAYDIAEKITYPIILKARSGGGGKGMRVVRCKDDLEKSFNTAKKEAENSFGDPEIYMEKYLAKTKHIEVQILADEFNNIIHLGARDCSLQMNHQKLVEEAPAYAICDDLLNKLYEYTKKAVKYISYTNAGTIEYLVDIEEQEVYFMEMNTRIQVEHPVSEMISGIDIVREQVNIASHKKLNYKQNQVNLSGHAIEFRINAYDFDNNFLPSAGKINELNLPGGYGVRIDSGIYQGYEILPFYDSMLMKVIAYASDRNKAISTMKRAMSELIIGGVKTNKKMYEEILEDDNYLKGNIDTSYMESKYKKGV